MLRNKENNMKTIRKILVLAFVLCIVMATGVWNTAAQADWNWWYTMPFTNAWTGWCTMPCSNTWANWYTVQFTKVNNSAYTDAAAADSSDTAGKTEADRSPANQKGARHHALQ